MFYSTMASKESIGSHSLDEHLENVKSLCRLCTSNAQTREQIRKNSTILASKWSEKIKTIFDIDIKNDSKTKHGDKICSGCDQFIRNIKKNNDTVSEKHLQKVKIIQQTNISFWQDYSAAFGMESCNVCSHKKNLSKGGRHKKMKRGAGTSYEHLTDIFSDMVTKCPEMETSKFDIVNLSDAQQRRFLCAICINILQPKSIMTPCGHFFCSKCLTGWWRSSPTSCPVCKMKDIDKSLVISTKQGNNLFYLQILELQIQCKTCKDQNSLEVMISHQCSATKLHPHISALLQKKDPPSAVTPGTSSEPPINFVTPVKPSKVKKKISTLDESLSKGIDDTPTKEEEKVFTHLLKRKKNKSKSGVVTAKTKGQPIHLHHIPNPRIHTNLASTKLSRSRDYHIRKARRFIAGRSRSSYTKQLCSEIKSLPKVKRLEIGKKTGLAPHKELTARMGLMMKAHANLSNRQSLKIKQCLKLLGVNYKTELAERIEKKQILSGTEIICSNMNFEFREAENKKAVNGIVIKPAACARVPSVVDMTIDYLERYSKSGYLTWRDGAIPADEIWAKVGGDKGGDKGANSTKLCLQILNLKTPNSVDFTHIFCNFYAPDNRTNLGLTIPLYSNQIQELDGHVWNGKTIKVVACGDCEFIFKTYGLAGAQGTYPCFLCLISNKDMRLPRKKQGSVKPRTLASIIKDYKQYKRAGCPVKKQAEYHNVTGEPYLRLELSKIVPPYLHILLGLTLKEFKLLLKFCFDLDIKLALIMVYEATPDTETAYAQYLQNLREKITLECHLSNLNEEIEELEDNCSLATLGENNAKIKKMEKQRDQVRNDLQIKDQQCTLPIWAGPVSGHVDDVLKNHGIHRERYHGGAFVGNACNKLLQKKVYTDICNGIETRVRSLTIDNTLIQEAIQIKSKFTKLFSLHSQIHHLIGGSGPLGKEDIEEAEQKIDGYMNYWRTEFPSESVTLKQHLLEVHTVPWLRKYKVGFGLMGEQGFESIHAKINEVEKNYRGELNQTKKGLYVLEKHFIQTAPEVLSETPKINRRKLDFSMQ